MKKMLFVEDDALSIKIMKKIFKADFEISICESAEEFYNEYLNQTFDIIIMDISIRGAKNGLDLIKEIKAMPSFDGVPILCLTAHAHSGLKQTALEAGSDYFLTKPVMNKVLKEAVNTLLKSK